MSDWQPIETAPMYETILVYVPPFEPMQGVCGTYGWMVGARSIIGKPPPSDPTHWMPLPDPPAPASQQSEDG